VKSLPPSNPAKIYAKMKKFWIILLLLTGSLSHQAQAPYFRLKDLNNQWKEYEDLRGSRLTVIDFWATWCQPCVKSIPLLDELAREFADDGVQFIGVSVDGTRNQAKIKPFVTSMGISYPILRDLNSELMAELSVSAVPTLIMYNQDGDQVYYHEGFRPGDEVIIREHILKELKR
jgi:thiol-disulfide isomerase/thioredoxin